MPASYAHAQAASPSCASLLAAAALVCEQETDYHTVWRSPAPSIFCGCGGAPIPLPPPFFDITGGGPLSLTGCCHHYEPLPRPLPPLPPPPPLLSCQLPASINKFPNGLFRTSRDDTTIQVSLSSITTLTTPFLDLHLFPRTFLPCNPTPTSLSCATLSSLFALVSRGRSASSSRRCIALLQRVLPRPSRTLEAASSFATSFNLHPLGPRVAYSQPHSL